MDKNSKLALERFGHLTIEVMKEVLASGKKLTAESLISGLSTNPEAVRWFADRSEALSQSRQTSDRALAELQEIKRRLEKSQAQKNDLLQQVAELEDSSLKSRNFYTSSLAVCSKLLQTKENQHLIPPLQSFNALLKKKAPLEKLEPAFRHVKDAALQDHIDPQAEKDAKGEDGNAPAAKGAVSAKSLESTYLNKLKELHQEILINVRLNIDKNYLSDLLKIEKRIKSSENIEDYLAVRRDILLLIEEYSAHTVEEREQAATFFKQVSERLLEVESQIVQSLTTVEETHREGRQFDNEFQSQLSAISETANFSKNLNELRDAVLFRLEHIQSAFKKKRTSDVKRMNALKERVGLLKQNFSSLKKEVSSARQRADSLEQELLLDPLTGIYNRRAYDKHIKEELQRYHRYNHEFSMLLFDVDHFKRINDNYGHAIGDRCLKEIINRIRTILRESDFLARVGGEEFLVILPATAAEQAAAVAEKVRKAVEKTEFIHNNEIVPITISIGVTAVQNSDHTPALLFSRADKAMYEAKNSGRNRVVQLH